MTKPDLTVTIEPSVSDKITYLPLGAPTADDEMKFVCRKIKKNTLWGNRFHGVYECLIKHSVGSDNISSI